MNPIDARNITWDLGRDITYEVLIENLGGYESAKYKLRDNGSLHAERLKKALLEYRRQHNIFEVGDKVVSIDKYSNDMIFTVAELTSKNVFTSMEFGEIAYSFVRHAKAEEIKAGKRLEVNDGST